MSSVASPQSLPKDNLGTVAMVPKTSLKKRLFDLVARPFQKMFRKASKWNVSLIEGVEPVYPYKIGAGQLLFSCPNRMVLWRAETLLSKEPETISWIDGFKPGDVFFDVGANIGVYSLYAAYRGFRCYSFEPESQNYALLNKNIYLNAFGDLVTAMNLAVSSSSKAGVLNLHEFQTGAALHNFGSAVDLNKQDFKPVFKQGVLSLSLDELVYEFAMPCPTHLKIDVDGIEREIIDGAPKLLADRKLKSVHIELNVDLPEDMEIKSILEQNGFSCANKAHAPRFDEGAFHNLFNFTFFRS